MKKSQKKQKNLGINNQTSVLVNRYRILKALEHASRKYANNVDETVREELKGTKEMKDLFVWLAISSCNLKVLANPEYLQSGELAIQSALFRILKEKDELENAIAEINYRELNHLGPEDNVDERDIEDYAAHLRYCINNPKVMKDYKLK